MKNKLLTLLAVAAAFFITSCNNNTPPVAVNLNDDPKEELHEKIVTLEGFIILSYTGGYVKLKPRIAAMEKTACNLNIITGEGNNQKKGIPNQYSNSDLKFKTDKGEVGGHGDYVRVTGQYIYDKYLNSFYIKEVSKIEKITAPTADYAKLGATELTPANLAQMNKKLAVIEGTLSLNADSFATDWGSTIFLFTNGKFTTPIHVFPIFASEPYPNATLALSQEATVADVVLHDKNKQPIDLTKKVRLYGTWIDEGDGRGTKQEFHTEEIEVIE